MAIHNFQELIEKLNTFWSKKGCIIAQPYGLEVGAGTANPQTFFRTLGPEPYNVAYVEPSRRPDDGRYGENPNRLQHYFQYQIVLKPIPKNNQDVYIEMLEELGVDPKKHDLRFVEDNWESPAIGAWGLGWEVWLDGMEISQYTYFQQIAGLPLEQPALEITIGLERLAMYILDVNNFKDILWNKDITYGELYKKHEYWQSLHNFETSSIVNLQNLYEIYEKLVEEQLDVGNYWAAYDWLLKMSHTFNLLDSRGVVSLSDRTLKFGEMGKFSKKIGQLWLVERKDMRYPLLKNDVAAIGIEPKIIEIPHGKENFKNMYILEIGLEELPAEYLSAWVSKFNLENSLDTILINNGLSFEKADLYFTPRRVVLVINNPSEITDKITTVRGPSKVACFDNSKPTEVLNGFMRRNRKTIDDVKFVTENGREIATVLISEKHQLNTVIENLLEIILKSAPDKRLMRWNMSNISFIRPIRWVVSYLNDKKINITVPSFSIGDDLDVPASSFTCIPRYSGAGRVLIKSAADYFSFISKYKIVLSQTDRGLSICKTVYKDSNKYFYSPNIEKYIDANVFMTESPYVGFVRLDSKFNILPRELITSVLEGHQKYLIRWSKTDERVIEYGVCANSSKYDERIISGNKKVVNARLEDALFYFNKDRGITLENLRPSLAKIVFHPKLGSYLDKVSRLNKLYIYIYQNVLGERIGQEMLEALKLIKNDKASHLVAEFADLEGIVGMNYALNQGYSKDTACILYEHYLPNSDSSPLPNSRSIAYLSLADKIDNIVSLSYAGELPKGSNDAFEVRKQVYNLIRLVRDVSLDINLYDLIRRDIELLNPTFNSYSEQVLSEVVVFINKRIYQLLKSDSSFNRLARGISFSKTVNIYYKFKLYEDMKSVMVDEDKTYFILDSFKRINNILKGYSGDTSTFSTELIETLSEKNINLFIKNNNNVLLNVTSVLELARLLEDFFKETMVNVKNEKIRLNRLVLLNNLNKIVQKVFLEDNVVEEKYE